MTQEQFSKTGWKMSYEEYEKCNCSTCSDMNCIHRKAFRRLPKCDGGLGMCKRLSTS